MTFQPPSFYNKPGGFREFSSIAYPLVISNISITLMHFIDRLFLSWSSPEEIAACIPAGVLTWAILSTLIGISEYTNTFIAQFYGAKNYPSIGKATWQGIYFSIACGLCSLLLYPVGLLIFDRIGHPSDVVVFEKQYFSILFGAGTFIILKESLSSFYSGRGKTKVIMTVNIAANLINAVLDYAFIFGFGFIPRMGIQGAALATSLSIVLACAIFLFLFLAPKNARTFHTRKAHFDWRLMKRMIRFGAPSGVHFFLEVSSYTAFIFIIGKLGKVELAASNIIISISSLAWLPMLGAGIATSTLVGQYIGRKDTRTAEKSAYTALIAIEIYMLFFALIYVLFPNALIQIFQGDNNNPDVSFEEILAYGRFLLVMVAAYQIGDAMNITFAGALRGAGDTAFTMWANAVCGWVLFVPGTWLTVVVFEQGVVGAWCWATAYIVMLGAIFWTRFRTGHWKTIRVVPEE